MNREHFQNLLPKRPENSHKGIFGSVLNIAGSGYYTGAAYFSSIAALKVGCGKSTLASVETVLSTTSALSPDIILMPLDETKEKTISPGALKKLEKVIEDYEAISVGCGISLNKETAIFFERLIKILNKLQIPVVIDASGLTILASRIKIPKIIQLPLNTVLTPHPKELAKLMGIPVEDILSQPEYWAKKCSIDYACITVLKLHETLVADNKGNFYVNKTGNSALSHGGSGDVLCGMITGFISQGLKLFDASCLAVYLHGTAAELASKDLSEYCTLASDLLDYIPKAIKSIL